MGNKLIILFLGFTLATSCLILDPYESKVEDEVVFQSAETVNTAVPSEFSWESMVYENVEILNSNTTVYNRQGEVIAEQLPLGKYMIPRNANDSIQCIQNTYVTFGASPCSESAKTITFPSEKSMGSFMVEDLFPYQGDMDFNDIVFSFSITYYLDDENEGKVSKMAVKILPKAIGGNAEMIGVALKFNSFEGKISKVSGASSLTGSNFTDISSNGTESGQNNCTVVPLVGDMRSLFASRQGFLNTMVSNDAVSSSPATVEIEFAEGNYPEYSSIINHILSNGKSGGVSFFVTVDSRGKEIFTKGNTPTDKFDYSLFKATGRTDFSNEDNFVWAIQNATQIAYPQEMVSIFDAYPKFRNWVNSLGTEDNGWFQSPETGKIVTFAI